MMLSLPKWIDCVYLYFNGAVAICKVVFIIHEYALLRHIWLNALYGLERDRSYDSFRDFELNEQQKMVY